MALIGKFRFRKSLSGKIVLQLEAEVKPFWRRSKPGPLKPHHPLISSMRALVALGLLAILSGPAAAQNWPNQSNDCRSYASTAKVQARRAFLGACGFTGLRWSENSG